MSLLCMEEESTAKMIMNCLRELRIIIIMIQNIQESSRLSARTSETILVILEEKMTATGNTQPLQAFYSLKANAKTFL